MKSLRIAEFGRALEAEERPEPGPAGAEVLLRVLACGVCHTDLHLRAGHYDLGGGRKLRFSERGIEPPLTPGHEVVGEVVAAGPEAEGVSAGERVLVYPWIGCGRCPSCRAGDDPRCAAPRFLGCFRDGGYSTHLLVPDARALFPLGTLPLPAACTFACAGLTVYDALRRAPRLGAGDPLVVIGCGGLGLTALRVARALGGEDGAILAVDRDLGKLEAAREAGADALVEATHQAAGEVQRCCGGGAAVVLDTVGSPASAEIGLETLRKGGRYIIAGLFGGEVRLALPRLPLRSLTLAGAYLGTRESLRELLALAESGRLAPIPVESRALADANQALDDLEAGRVTGRLVLVP